MRHTENPGSTQWWTQAGVEATQPPGDKIRTKPGPPHRNFPSQSRDPRKADRRTRDGKKPYIHPGARTAKKSSNNKRFRRAHVARNTDDHRYPALQRFCVTPLSLAIVNTILGIYSLLSLKMELVTECSGGDVEATHLCVLVHGLWGNPAHMAQVAKSLRDKHPRDRLRILVAKRNSGSFTYDGIELGGERVCDEIEEELRLVESQGGKIKKLSIVGYSLGGLVSRYAIGLLHARGTLDDVECMNFTAFASPFLGVRTPLKGLSNKLWNVLGARTLCMSGRQLFGIDQFRDTGRPLLAVLTDPNSIFMSGLRRFKRHTLYANIVNDRVAVYYTTGISKTDPYADLSRIRVRYVKGYDDVVLDPEQPFTLKSAADDGGQPLAGSAFKWTKRIPFFLALAVFMPIGIMAFLVNSGIQTMRSSKRVKAHNRGLAGIDVSAYRLLPLWIKEVRGAVEDAYEELNSSQAQEYLASSSEDEARSAGGRGGTASKADAADDSDASGGDTDEDILALERRQSHPAQPTLALAPYQFEMIKSLDTLKWRKYPVWIHENRHSHAAIIVRQQKSSFREGWTVFRHWMDEEFII